MIYTYQTITDKNKKIENINKNLKECIKMNRKKLMGKIITAVIAGGVLISTGTAVFAASTTSSSTDTNGKKQEARMNMKNPSDMMKSELDKLVTAGTITADQETAILNNVKQEQTVRQAEMDKIKNMTESERTTYFESKKTTEKTDFLSNLVTAGTLTQTQADAIKSAVPQGPGGKGDRKDGGQSPEKMKTQLDTLVTAGTITQDEETKIINYFTEKQTARKAEMDKVKDMTEADRKAYFESKKTTEKTDMFSELVTTGIITQDKADAIKAAMPAPKAPAAPQDTTTNQ
jgi:polyhydroxyalkanoate synthesis regulator phasin